jgi:hypothetical protein
VIGLTGRDARDPGRLGPPLRLLRQATVASLVADVAPDLHRFEASGVCREADLLWIVCDNLPHVVGVPLSLQADAGEVRVIREPGHAAGYEDITWDREDGHRFALIEAARSADGRFRPLIDEFDPSWRRIARRTVDLTVESLNKGLEGLSCVRRDGRRHLLGLSEGNDNLAGRLGRRPGGGLVHVLVEQGERWVVSDLIHLPEVLPFVDYSALGVSAGRIAVVSQESSALWVGRLDPSAWRVVDDGRVFAFPRDHDGRIRYGTVEGICWLDERTVAAVSDRPKPHEPDRLHQTGESVHLFEVPRA